MRDSNSRISSIVVVMLLLLGSMIILHGSENASGEERDNEIRITWGGLRQWQPSVFGDKITWKSDYGDILVYDAKTTEVRRESWGFDAGISDIYGKYVVYEDGRAGSPNWDIYLLDTETGTEYHMFDGSDAQREPRIWGDRIVWLEKNGDNWKVAYGSVRSSAYSFFNYDDSNQTNPDICGRKLVYQDDSNGNWDIYYRDFSDRVEIQITTNSYNQINPRIYGDRVVWTDFRNGSDNTDIYMYDLLSKTEKQITFDTSIQRYPVIYDDIIVWQDYRMGNWDIFMMDLKDGVPIQVTTDPFDQKYPDVYGDIIVWEDHRQEAAGSYNELNIFMTFIDQDNDGIYDWDDSHPTIQHIPLEGLDYKMDMLMVQLKFTEQNLTSRVQSLRMEVATGFSDLKVDILKEVENGIDEILADLDTHDNILSGTNNTMRIEFAALKADMVSMRENQTASEEEELDMINGYLEALEELILQMELNIGVLMAEISDDIGNGRGLNISTRMENIQTSLDELQKLDEIVTDLETISKNVEKMEGNTDDKGVGFFEVIVIILLSLILFLVFLIMFKRRGPQYTEDDEDWN